MAHFECLNVEEMLSGVLARLQRIPVSEFETPAGSLLIGHRHFSEAAAGGGVRRLCGWPRPGEAIPACRFSGQRERASLHVPRLSRSGPSAKPSDPATQVLSIRKTTSGAIQLRKESTSVLPHFELLVSHYSNSPCLRVSVVNTAPHDPVMVDIAQRPATGAN